MALSLPVPLDVPQDAPASGVRLLAGESCYAGPVRTEDPLAELVETALSGDSAATRRLLDAIAPAMLATVRAVLGRGHRDVEDVLQDALVGMMRALPSFRGESTVLHFSRAVALRRALDQRRAFARRGPEEEVNPDDERLRDPGGSPAASAVAAQRRHALRAVLSELRPEQAEAFARRVILGSSVDEIARETAAPVETVRSRLRLAKNALRARITNDPALLELSEINDDDAP